MPRRLTTMIIIVARNARALITDAQAWMRSAFMVGGLFQAALSAPR
jgi:hypothetical protein